MVYVYLHQYSLFFKIKSSSPYEFFSHILSQLTPVNPDGQVQE